MEWMIAIHKGVKDTGMQWSQKDVTEDVMELAIQMIEICHGIGDRDNRDLQTVYLSLVFRLPLEREKASFSLCSIYDLSLFDDSASYLASD